MSRISNTIVVCMLALSPRLLLAQTLTTASAPSSDKCDVKRTGDVCFAFFADGNVRKAIDKKDGATPASGSVGFSVARDRSLFSGQINIADKPDTVTRGYGASLITPGAGGALSAGVVDYRYLPKRDRSQGFGYHLYGSISSSRWATDTNASGAATATTDAAIVGLGALGTWVVADGAVSDNPVFIALDGGISYRQLFGDIATQSNNALKTRLYGTRQEGFFGLEAGLILQINSLKAGLNYYFYKGSAPGVTDGQVVAGFSIQSNVFAGRLAR